MSIEPTWEIEYDGECNKFTVDLNKEKGVVFLSHGEGYAAILMEHIPWLISVLQQCMEEDKTNE